MANKKIFEVAMVLSATDKASRTTADSVAKTKKQLQSLSNLSNSAFSVGRNAGAIGLGILAPLGLAVNAAEESDIAFRRLSSTFRTMGESNDVAARAAADYASVLQTSIGVEDEEIQLVQSKIASFRRVSDETARMSGVFDRATAAAFDLAAGGFGEASSNAVQLGKALQNPAMGAAALSKAGALNKADIPLIKQIQATKGLGAAQEFVLQAVERQVKGQAANTATSAAKMKIAFGEVAETAGKVLLPTITQSMASVGRAADRFNRWAQDNPRLTGTILKVVGAVGALSLTISAASFVFGGLVKVYQAGIFVKQTYIAWTNAERLSKLRLSAVVWATIAQERAAAAGKWILTAAQSASLVPTYLATAAQWALNAALLANPITWVILGVVALIAVVVLLVKNWDRVSAFFVNLWARIKQIFSKAWAFIKEYGWLMVGPVGWIIKFWSMIPAWFAQLWPRVKAIFMTFVNWLVKLPETFFRIGGEIITGIWNGIKAKAQALFDYVKEVGKKIAGAFKSVLGIASPSKVFMDYGVNITEGARKGIEKGQGSVIAASRGVGQSISPNSARSGGGGMGGMTFNFSPVINGGGNSQDVTGQIRALVPQLIREIESAWERKKRLAY